MDQTSWSPQRKVVGGALAVVLMVIIQMIFPDLDIPIGLEGSLAILAAYLIPDRS